VAVFHAAALQNRYNYICMKRILQYFLFKKSIICAALLLPFLFCRSVSAGEFLWAYGGDLPRNIPLRDFHEHGDRVWGAVFSPDARTVLSGGDDRHLMLGDTSGGALLRDIRLPSGILSVAFSPDGSHALAAAGDNSVVIFNTASGILEHTLRGHSDYAHSAVFTPDGKYVISASHDKTLRLWDVSTGATVRVFSGHSAGVTCVAVSPDGKYAVSGSSDNTARLWDLSNGKTVRVFPHKDYVHAVAFTPDGKYIVTASYDRTAVLWNLSTGQKMRVFRHLCPVTAVAVSPDGRYLLTGGWDGNLDLWSTADGTLLNIISGHQGHVWSVSFSPDGRYALSACDDGKLRLWNPELDYSAAAQAVMLADNPRPLPPGDSEPGTLTRGERESRYDFTRRATAARMTYESSVARYNAAISAGPTEQQLGRAFAGFYGKPEIGKVDCSGDISFHVVSDAGNAVIPAKRDYVFTLDSTVSGNARKALCRKIAKAQARVYFIYTPDGSGGGTISPEKAEAETSDGVYPAHPSGKAEPETVSRGKFFESAIVPSALALQPDSDRIQAVRRGIGPGTAINGIVSSVDTPGPVPAALRTKDYAVIAGIEKYKDALHADYALRDAEAMKKYFLSQGLPESNILILENSTATLAALNDALANWLPSRVTAGSNVYFYFSGCGEINAQSGEGYVLPWNMPARFGPVTGLALGGLYTDIARLNPRSALVVLDAAYETKGGDSGADAVFAPPSIYYAAPPAGLAVIAAPASDAVSDVYGHGLLTYYFLKGSYAGISEPRALCGYLDLAFPAGAARLDMSAAVQCPGIK